MHEQLYEAAELVKITNTCMDPTVLAFEQLVQLMSAYVLYSFTKYYEYLFQLQALIIIDGMPLLCITFNPSNLRCLIILWLARVSLLVSNVVVLAFKIATAIINPVTIATFFDKICKAIFDYLLTAEFREGGFFGPVSTYFGTIETNGRGMLHLHCLIWLKSMTNLSNF